MSDGSAPIQFSRLPNAVIAAIRAGAWNTTDAPSIRILARTASQAVHLGIDADPILVLLALHVRADMPAPAGVRADDLTAIGQAVDAILASSTATPPASDADSGVAGAIDAARSWLENERAGMRMDEAEADRILREELTAAQIRFPELGLSFGYIGNIWTSPFLDDRSFRFFTNLKWSDSGHSVSHGDHPAGRLGELAFMVGRGSLVRFCEECRERLASGRYASRIARAA